MTTVSKPKPTEVRLLTNMLEQAFLEADSAEGELDLEEVSVSLLEALQDKRDGAAQYAAICYIPFGDTAVWKGYGPYSTKHQAEKAGAKVVAPGPDPGVWRVVTLKQATAV